MILAGGLNQFSQTPILQDISFEGGNRNKVNQPQKGISKYTLWSGLSALINILCTIKLHQKVYQRRPEWVPLELK